MKRTPIYPSLTDFPEQFHPFLRGAKIYDSSCSTAAKVYFIDKDCGYYLKSSAKGSLRQEAAMTRYFHSKHLSAEVIDYHSDMVDWLLTSRVAGEDCTHARFLENPKRLAETTGALLRALHETDCSDCPVQNRMSNYIHTAQQNYQNGNYDTSLFPEHWGFASADEAWKVVLNNTHRLKADVLLHGDYCLPNVLFHDDWKFSGFIDLGNGGVGDRHIDLFWGIWTLYFNLKTNEYADRFLDAYGRDKVDEEMFRVIAAFEMFG